MAERNLSPEFENALLQGILNPLLDKVHRDRDLILEIRRERVDIYCKGHVALSVKPRANGFGYVLSAHKAFLKEPATVTLKEEVKEFVEGPLPFIKQRIAEHKGSREIEFDRLIVRMNNREIGLNTEYFVVDRQIDVSGKHRFDMLGVHWPREKRSHSASVTPALIEVKYSLSGGVESLSDQLRGYYEVVAEKANEIAEQIERTLRKKLHLDLITGGSTAALAKLKNLPVTKDINQFRFVVVLVDCNPNSRLLDVDLDALPFAEQVDVFKLGLGLWKKNLVKDGGRGA